MSRIISSAPTASTDTDARRRVGLELLGDDGIDRQHDLALRGLGLGHDLARGVDEVGFDQRLADRLALRQQERVGHGAADDQHIDLRQQIAEQVELGRHLGAADDRGHRPLRMLERLAERLEFGLHGAAGIGRQHVAEAFGRGMRAVRGGEGVVDPDVAELGQRGDEGRVVLLLARVEAGVLQAEDVALLHGGDRRFGGLADAVVGELRPAA